MGAPPAGPPVVGPPPAVAAMAPASGGSNTLKYVGVGCGLLIALSCLCSGAWWAYGMFVASSVPGY
jgi:hypothetical protein